VSSTLANAALFGLGSVLARKPPTLAVINLAPENLIGRRAAPQERESVKVRTVPLPHKGWIHDGSSTPSAAWKQHCGDDFSNNATVATGLLAKATPAQKEKGSWSISLSSSCSKSQTSNFSIAF
jgi:hypothetical protein